MLQVYEANSPVKRQRATRAQMAERRLALYEIVAEQQPMTVRQVFYQATVRGVVDKTEESYAKVQRLLVDLRRQGVLPYEWIADNTRWMRKPRTFSGPEEALRNTAVLYRKALWNDADAYVEIWLEKDALAGVVIEVTREFDVPLMVSRGYASLSFLHSAAKTMANEDRPCFVYYFGDHDPSGVNAAEKIEEAMRDLAPGAEIHFTRAAVTPEQIESLELPTRPTKATDSRAKSWGGGDRSVELDAIRPNILRGLVRAFIEEHMPPTEFARLRRIEEAERDTLREVVGTWFGKE